MTHEKRCTTSTECLCTGTLAVLIDTSDLGDIYVKGDDYCRVKILIVYYFMLYITYVTLIMRLWDLYNPIAIFVEFDMNSLLLFPPHFRRSLGLCSPSQFGSYRVKLIPKFGVPSVVCCLRLSLIYYICYIIYTLSFDITPYL